MQIEKYLDDFRYTLTNENLKEGDRVYPILNGRVREDGTFIIHDIEFMSKYQKDFNTSGFPGEPHRIENLKHSDYKPYEVRTDHGYGPIEKYFKIEKAEKRIVTVRESGVLKFTDTTWLEVNVEETIDKIINELKLQQENESEL